MGMNVRRLKNDGSVSQSALDAVEGTLRSGRNSRRLENDGGEGSVDPSQRAAK